MRMLTGRVMDSRALAPSGNPNFNSQAGFQFNLDNARPAGPQHIIRAAKDPIAREPTDERVQCLLKRTLTRAKLTEDRTQWEITGMVGEPYMLTLGASYELWVIACEFLLRQAMADK